MSQPIKPDEFGHYEELIMRLPFMYNAHGGMHLIVQDGQIFLEVFDGEESIKIPKTEFKYFDNVHKDETGFAGLTKENIEKIKGALDIYEKRMRRYGIQSG